jgi:hypothetical protein
MTGLGTLVLETKKHIRKRLCKKCNFKFYTAELPVGEVRLKLRNLIEVVNQLLERIE